MSVPCRGPLYLSTHRPGSGDSNARRRRHQPRPWVGWSRETRETGAPETETRSLVTRDGDVMCHTMLPGARALHCHSLQSHKWRRRTTTSGCWHHYTITRPHSVAPASTASPGPATRPIPSSYKSQKFPPVCGTKFYPDAYNYWCAVVHTTQYSTNVVKVLSLKIKKSNIRY